MYVEIKNENYGYAVATYGDYVVVANPPPPSFRWNIDSASLYYTGSVDLFRYNRSTDLHDYVATLYKNFDDFPVILASETGSPTPPSLVTGSLVAGTVLTETNGTYSEYDLLIEKDLYTASVDDGFGSSLDMYGKDRKSVV